MKRKDSYDEERCRFHTSQPPPLAEAHAAGKMNINVKYECPLALLGEAIEKRSHSPEAEDCVGRREVLRKARTHARICSCTHTHTQSHTQGQTRARMHICKSLQTRHTRAHAHTQAARMLEL